MLWCKGGARCPVKGGGSGSNPDGIDQKENFLKVMGMKNRYKIIKAWSAKCRPKVMLSGNKSFYLSYR